MRKIYIFTIVVILLMPIVIAGCDTVSDTTNGDRVVKYGDTVHLEYVGRLDDGTTFDTSRGREPLVFTLGDEEMLPAFENGILGMRVGEKKTFTIPAEQAYGLYYPEKVVVFPRTMIPQDITPEVGMQLQQTQEDGSVIIATIIEVNEDSITLDANFPLAGEDLTFEVELLQIE